MSRTTLCQKIDNVKYFRSLPASNKPDTDVRNVCVRSIDSRSDKHGSELEPNPLFVQDSRARPGKQGQGEEGETASIHHRITQDFMDTESCKQDKSNTEVLSNYTCDNDNRNQSEQVMRASCNAIIPRLGTTWVHVKGRCRTGGEGGFPNPSTSRFDRLTDVRTNIQLSPSSSNVRLSLGLKKQGIEIIQANHFLGGWREGKPSLSIKLTNHSNLPFQVKKGQRLGWMAE